MRKKRHYKRLILVAGVLPFLLYSINTYVYGQSNEPESDQMDYSPFEYKTINENEAPFSLDGKKEFEVEIRYPNKLKSNKSVNETDKKENTGIATEPSKSRADLIEDVSNANKEYPIHHGTSKKKKKKAKSSTDSSDQYSADARQFITFQTKNGKTFYMIIDHDETEDNVTLLTEVTEDDLLNMVNTKGGFFDKPVKQEELVQEQQSPVEDVVKKEEKKDNTFFYIISAAIIVAILYYFKRKKQEDEEEEDNEEEEYDEEEDLEGESTDNLL